MRLYPIVKSLVFSKAKEGRHVRIVYISHVVEWLRAISAVAYQDYELETH